MTKKEIIKKQLWTWGYSVKDMENIMPGLPYDLVVNNKYKVAVLEKIKREEAIKMLEGSLEINVVAMVYRGLKIYAGGDQEEKKFTTRHQDIFKKWSTIKK
jgi:hypothetical protein